MNKIETWDDLRAKIAALEKRLEAAYQIIKQMDCDCAGEGVSELGGCFRCLALDQLKEAK